MTSRTHLIELYSRNAPFIARLKRRQRLTAPTSTKATQHLEIDLSGSSIRYECGDSVGVLPSNRSRCVSNLLEALSCPPDTSVEDREGNSLSIEEFLRYRANIATVPKRLVAAVRERLHPGSEDHKTLSLLLDGADRSVLKSYLANHHVWDFLATYRNASIAPQMLCSLLQPLLPRFYSIASSQSVVGDEVHLTVAPVAYSTNTQKRVGVATHWLCDELSEQCGEVPLFVQQARHFRLPQDDAASIIMVGPGTGVAPFRAFMQERLARGAKGDNWLFFGEWTEAGEFLYGDYWKTLHRERVLRLSTAFSREQSEKVYVQQRMLEEGRELYRWLEEGAYFYVCGDAKQMAKAVDITLQQVVATHRPCSEEEAARYVKALRDEGRYMKDVY